MTQDKLDQVVRDAAFSKKIAEAGLPGTKHKPGWQTTEFWILIVVILAASILVGLGKLEPAAFMQAITLSGGAYKISRGLAKR